MVCILIIWAIGSALSHYFPIPLPGAVIALALLFFGFFFVPPFGMFVTPAARYLLRHFPLFLYPLGAGFLTLSGLPVSVFLKIGIAILVSLVASMSLCALTFRCLKRVR